MLSLTIFEQFVLIIFLGSVGQWLGWLTNIPSILLLLVFGILFGPVLGMIKPDFLFGELLMPLVAFSIAIILFEGGLTLRFSELKKSGPVILRLITIGTAVSWALNTMAALWILNLDLILALLLGAILVVTGPTVIMPMLRHIKPTNRVASVIKWEGIVNDPVGAGLSVLVFEAALATGITEAGTLFVWGIFKTILIGAGVGLVVGGILLWMLYRHLIPDFLQNSFVLMGVVFAFAVSNYFQAESGLLTVTVLGIMFANQRIASIRHVIEFKESLQVILIAALFITLAAQLNVQELMRVKNQGILFVLFLIFVARPLSVYVATRKQKITWREQVFIAFLAPRGIIAGAVSVIFAIELVHHGNTEAHFLVPYTFITILGTVLFYGLLAKPLAVFLKLAHPDPQGLLILGSHRWARNLAKLLQGEGIEVILVDSNQSQVNKARLAGLPAYQGNILSEGLLERINLGHIGNFVALTENDNVNTLSTLHMSYIFNRSSVFQLAPDSFATDDGEGGKFRSRLLFQDDLTYTMFTNCLRHGGHIKKTCVSEEFTYEGFREHHGAAAIPLFVLDKNGRVQVCATDKGVNPQPGDIIFYLNLPPH